MTTFQTGKTYYTRSIGDHNCIFSIEVLKRTKCMLTVKTGMGELKTLRINKKDSAYFNAEAVKPEGSYSFAPIITADKDERPLKDWEK